MAQNYNWIKPWTRKPVKAVRNPHLWGIVAMFVVITAIYYWDIFISNERWDWFFSITYFEFRYNLHGSLYCIPIIYAASIFWWRGAVTGWFLAILLILPRAFYFRPDAPALFRNIFYLLIPTLLIVYLAIEISWREKERKASQERESERKLYMHQVLKAQEDERRRISQELHDGTTQTLIAIANNVQSLISDGSNIDDSEKKAKLELVRNASVSLSEEVKRICLDLRPKILDDLGLIPALSWLINQLRTESRIAGTIEVKGVSHKLSPEVEVNLFRIVQEALNNIKRHSLATKVNLTLEFGPQHLKIIIKDNGQGFPLEKTIGECVASGKLGLLGMQERAQLLNGVIKLDTENGRGTTISLEVQTI
jgi:two-component system, NarL family, sensor histidine kinase DegS